MAETQINNKWINDEDDIFLFFSGGITLPLDTYKESLLHINLEIHKLTCKYELLMPLSPDYCKHYGIDQFEHYKQYLIENQAESVLFQIKNYEFYKKNINRVSKIHFVNTEGDLISKYVHYIFNGLYGNPVVVESKPNYKNKNELHQYAYDDCPLWVCGTSFTEFDDEIRVGFQIKSSCSIWMDEAPNFKYMDKDGSVTFFEYSDNRDIAYKNTPRLNSFIRGVKELIISYGGECHLYDYFSYLKTITKTSEDSRNEALNRNGLLLNGELIYQEDLEESNS